MKTALAALLHWQSVKLVKNGRDGITSRPGVRNQLRHGGGVLNAEQRISVSVTLTSDNTVQRKATSRIDDLASVGDESVKQVIIGLWICRPTYPIISIVWRGVECRKMLGAAHHTERRRLDVLQSLVGDFQSGIRQHDV